MSDPKPHAPYTGGLSEEQRDDILNLLELDRVPIWADEAELDEGHFHDWRLSKWMTGIGHPKAHPGCCQSCGCCIACMGAAFFDSTVTTVLRELNRHGLLRDPSERRSPPGADAP